MMKYFALLIFLLVQVQSRMDDGQFVYRSGKYAVYTTRDILGREGRDVACRNYLESFCQWQGKHLASMSETKTYLSNGHTPKCRFQTWHPYYKHCKAVTSTFGHGKRQLYSKAQGIIHHSDTYCGNIDRYFICVDGPSGRQSCPDVQTNIDYPGNDLNAGGMYGRVRGHLPSAAACRAACKRLRGCVGYTFVKSERWPRDNCAVKSSWKEGSRRSSSCCDSQKLDRNC